MDADAVSLSENTIDRLLTRHTCFILEIHVNAWYFLYRQMSNLIIRYCTSL